MPLSDWLPQPLRVAVQGATGFQGRRHIALMKAYGTNIVAGVSPRAVADVDGVPIFTTLRAAREATGVNASIVFLPAPLLAEGIIEALDQELPLVVAVTEGAPLHDMFAVRRRLETSKARLIGPNTPGLLTPQAKLGFFPHEATMPGDLVLVTRSGTLSYEVASALREKGLGLRYWIGIGGDPVKGTTFEDVVIAARDEPGITGIVIVGEIGGTGEEDAAAALRAHPPSIPVFALIAGASAPPGIKMGHAGAMVNARAGDYAGKVEALRAAGVNVLASPTALARTAKEALLGV